MVTVFHHTQKETEIASEGLGGVMIWSWSHTGEKIIDMKGLLILDGMSFGAALKSGETYQYTHQRMQNKHVHPTKPRRVAHPQYPT
jgi:hypothetical protein